MSKAKILIVEDDEKLRNELQIFLNKNGVVHFQKIIRNKLF